MDFGKWLLANVGEWAALTWDALASVGIPAIAVSVALITFGIQAGRASHQRRQDRRSDGVRSLIAQITRTATIATQPSDATLETLNAANDASARAAATLVGREKWVLMWTQSETKRISNLVNRASDLSNGLSHTEREDLMNEAAVVARSVGKVVPKTLVDWLHGEVRLSWFRSEVKRLQGEGVIAPSPRFARRGGVLGRILPSSS